MDKRFYWLTGFIVIGILLGTGFLFLVTRPPRGNPITLLPPPTSAPITVYVTGMVNLPGVYSLPAASRLEGAIQAAGGLNEQADVSVVNLAEILQDGQHIDIPGSTVQPEVRSAGIPTAEIVSVVNINTASLEQLDILPGIGPAIAQDIIDYRLANGKFQRIEDILAVPGIGQAKYEAIRDLITVETSP